MCIRKDTCIEKTRLIGTEEPVLVSKERIKRLKRLFCLVVEGLSIHNGGIFEQLFLGGKTEFARYRETDKWVV